MPASRAEGRILGAEPDAHGGLETGSDGEDQCAAARALALGDRQRGRNDLRRGVAQRRPVHVANGDRRDEIAVQQRRSGERELLAADDGRFARIAERAGKRADLPALVALASVREDADSDFATRGLLPLLSHLLQDLMPG